MESQSVVIEHLYNAPIERIWSALTDIRKMRRWYFPTLADFKPEVDFETIFNVENDGKIYPHIWKITEVIPGRKISYEWKFGGFPGNSLLSYELFAETAGNTKIILIHQMLETFQADIYPEFSQANFLEGWTYFIGKELKEFVEGNVDD